MSTVDLSLPETLTPAETLQLQHCAMRVSFTWWGTTRTLRPDQKREIADDFDADVEILSASKRTINRKHPAYKAMTKVKRSVTSFWKAKTLPYPEPGIRLLPQSKLEEFEAFMQSARLDLYRGANDLQAEYAKNRTLGAHLGRLYDDGDYPEDISGLFGVYWNVENVSAPAYLLALSPKLYEREMHRVRCLFNKAVELQEQEFVGQFAKLIDHMVEMLTDNSDGTPKSFRDASIHNLQACINRFKDLSVRSNDDLEKLVQDCEGLTRGVTAKQFHSYPELRKHVSEKLAEVKDAMSKQVVSLPRRKIVRRPTPSEK
jgi:hypothetical protein